MILVLFLHSLATYSNSSTDSLLNDLDHTLQNKEKYFFQKTKRIEDLTRAFIKVRNHSNYLPEYNLCIKLFNEYESFKYDSAYYYIVEASKAANHLHDPQKTAFAKIKTGFVLLSSGMFKESLDTLNSITPDQLPDSLQYEYYSIIGRTYYDLADYVKGTHFETVYNTVGNHYQDRAINLTPRN